MHFRMRLPLLPPGGVVLRSSEEAGGDAAPTGTEAGGSQSMEGEFRVRRSKVVRLVRIGIGTELEYGYNYSIVCSPVSTSLPVRGGHYPIERFVLVRVRCDGRSVRLLEQFGGVVVRESDLPPILQSVTDSLEDGNPFRPYC